MTLTPKLAQQCLEALEPFVKLFEQADANRDQPMDNRSSVGAAIAVSDLRRLVYVHADITAALREALASPAKATFSTCAHCLCSQWVVTYGHDLKPGEMHHRDCKHWHRVLGEAIVTKTEFMVLGDPHDDESHNCDAMGCSSVSHVLVRMPLSALLDSGEGDGATDAARLDWLIFYSARVKHTSDAEYCIVEWSDEDWKRTTKPFGNAREAIDAAMKGNGK